MIRPTAFARPLAAVLRYGPASTLIAGSAAADLVAMARQDPARLAAVLPPGWVGRSWLETELASLGLCLLGVALLRAKRVGFWMAFGALLFTAIRGIAAGAAPMTGAIAGCAALALAVTSQAYDVGSGAVVPAAILVGVGGAAEMARLPWIALAAVVAACASALQPVPDRRSSSELGLARAALRAHGRGALLPYQLDGLALPVATSDGRGALAYARAGRAAVMLGDPAGEPGADLDAMTEWLELSRKSDWLPIVYQASAPLANRERARGAFACRIGSEAVLNPTTFDLGSPRLANVRHTITRSRKGGMEVRCWIAGTTGASVVDLDKLVAVDAEWRRAAGPALGFTTGTFDPRRLDGTLVAAAVDGSNEPVAFIVLRPTGADGGWMLDVMRRRRQAVPGVIEACLAEGIRVLAGMGVRRLSLGLVPLGRLSTDEGSRSERCLAFLARTIRPIYDVRGLEFFKAKFDPTWEARFLVVPGPWQLPGALLALVRLHLGVSWPRVLRSLVGPAGGLRGTMRPSRSSGA